MQNFSLAKSQATRSHTPQRVATVQRSSGPEGAPGETPEEPRLGKKELNHSSLRLAENLNFYQFFITTIHEIKITALKGLSGRERFPLPSTKWNVWLWLFHSSSLRLHYLRDLLLFRVGNDRDGSALWVLDHGEAAHFGNITQWHDDLSAELFRHLCRGISVIDCHIT